MTLSELRKEFFEFYRTCKTCSKEEVWAWFEKEFERLNPTNKDRWCECAVKAAELEIKNKRLLNALHAIKRHQELLTNNSVTSVVLNIANKALEEFKDE